MTAALVFAVSLAVLPGAGEWIGGSDVAVAGVLLVACAAWSALLALTALTLEPAAPGPGYSLNTVRPRRKKSVF